MRVELIKLGHQISDIYFQIKEALIASDLLYVHILVINSLGLLEICGIWCYHKSLLYEQATYLLNGLINLCFLWQSLLSQCLLWLTHSPNQRVYGYRRTFKFRLRFIKNIYWLLSFIVAKQQNIDLKKSNENSN